MAAARLPAAGVAAQAGGDVVSLIARGFTRRGLGDSNQELVPPRSATLSGSVRVTSDSAMRHSAVWGCRTLRAGLVSSTPLDVFRQAPDGRLLEVPKPPVLRMPGGERVGLPQWLYASEMDLSGWGNAVGIITARDGNGLPAEIELQHESQVTILGKGARITGFRISGKRYDPEEIWHEVGPVVSGIPIGLNPIAYAASSIGGYLSAQQFALDWFAGGAAPKGVLKNTEMDLISPAVAAEQKARFKEATAGGDIFVTGSIWEWTPATMTAAGAAFLDEMKFGAAEVCRFFGVPADMIDAGTSSSAITYSNITQRNLQFLILHMGPSFVRREWSFSQFLVAQPRVVKFNTDAILRMDPETRERLLIAQVAGRTRAPSEARALANLEPFTEDQLAEFDRLFAKGTQPPQQTTPQQTKEA